MRRLNLSLSAAVPSFFHGEILCLIDNVCGTMRLQAMAILLGNGRAQPPLAEPTGPHPAQGATQHYDQLKPKRQKLQPLPLCPPTSLHWEAQAATPMPTTLLEAADAKVPDPLGEPHPCFESWTGPSYDGQGDGLPWGAAS